MRFEIEKLMLTEFIPKIQMMIDEKCEMMEREAFNAGVAYARWSAMHDN